MAWDKISTATRIFQHTCHEPGPGQQNMLGFKPIGSLDSRGILKPAALQSLYSLLR